MRIQKPYVWLAVIILSHASGALLWHFLSKPTPRPGKTITAPQTDRFRGFETGVVSLPVEIPFPSEDEVEDLRREYNRPDLDPISEPDGAPYLNLTIPLTEIDLPKLPEGGTALVVREPDGSLSVEVRDIPRRAVEFGSEWTFEVGWLAYPENEEIVVYRGKYSFVRFGNLRPFVEAGRDRAGDYAMVGLSWSSGGPLK